MRSGEEGIQLTLEINGMGQMGGTVMIYLWSDNEVLTYDTSVTLMLCATSVADQSVAPISKHLIGVGTDSEQK